jgi:hypothetical protein
MVVDKVHDVVYSEYMENTTRNYYFAMDTHTEDFKLVDTLVIKRIDISEASEIFEVADNYLTQYGVSFDRIPTLELPWELSGSPYVVFTDQDTYLEFYVMRTKMEFEDGEVTKNWWH